MPNDKRIASKPVAHRDASRYPLAAGSSARAAGATAAALSWRSQPMPIDNPHELLGLVAGEKNVLAIVEAARSRLARIREANGSEDAVKAYVIGQICRARAAMLKAARRATAGRDREGQRSTGTMAAGRT